jgi:hypothetical protein
LHLLLLHALELSLVSIRQHTSAYVSIRQHTSPPCARALPRQHTSAYVSIRQHTSAYVSRARAVRASSEVFASDAVFFFLFFFPLRAG